MNGYLEAAFIQNIDDKKLLIGFFFDDKDFKKYGDSFAISSIGYQREIEQENIEFKNRIKITEEIIRELLDMCGTDDVDAADYKKYTDMAQLCLKDSKNNKENSL